MNRTFAADRTGRTPRRRHRFWCLILPVAAVVLQSMMGCSTPNSPDPSQLPGEVTLEFTPFGGETQELNLPNDVDLETELRLLIESHSQGQGLDFFKLADSENLAGIPQDPLNPLNGPKITVGMYLFQEPALAVNNVRPEGKETWSCASCHPTQSAFYSNLPQGIGEGGSGFGSTGEGRVTQSQYVSPSFADTPPIRVPTILNVAYQDNIMWDGRLGAGGVNVGTEGQWQAGNGTNSNLLGWKGPETQAHAGLGGHRFIDVIDSSSVATNPQYMLFLSLAFPSDPAPSKLNVAKAIAAFERIVLTNQAPFQLWLRGKKKVMTDSQKIGAMIFFSKGNCVSCHTGPALNSVTFHGLGMNDLDGAYDPTRVNLSPFGGTVPLSVRKGRGGFTGVAADEYKFKTPQLYNLKDSPFYGHGSSFATVREVIEYLNAAVPENVLVPTGQLAAEFVPLGLSSGEIDALTDFVENALYDPNLMRYFAFFVPSGLCFPSNDPQSQIDLGCSALLSSAPVDGRRPR